MTFQKYLSAALILATSLFLSNSVVLAEADAVHKMAQIVMHLNHYPSSADKKVLSGIAERGTTAEATMAKALMHMEHHVRPSDKTKLSEIAKDSSQPDRTRDLAQIIHNLSHMPSAADKEKLRGM